MECYYDSLFECECAGISDLANVPCAYFWGSPTYTRQLGGLIPFFPGNPNPTFIKRLKWITACAQISHFMLHCLDYLKGNSTKYFVEADQLWLPFRYPWGWWPRQTNIEKHRCFYLGTYPHIWNRRFLELAPAGEIISQQSFNIGQTPEIPDFHISEYEKKMVNSLIPTYGKEKIDEYLAKQRMNKQYREAFWADAKGILVDIDKEFDQGTTPYSKYNVLEYAALKIHMDTRKAAFDKCNEREYPRSIKTPQYKTKEPQGEVNFPGIPLNELNLPAPTEAPTPAPAPGKQIMKLQIGLGIKWPSEENAYTLRVLIE